MVRCLSCSTEVAEGSRFCPSCGEALATEGGSRDSPTVTAPKRAGDARVVHPAPSGSSSDSIDQARFTPGTMLTERYRIVGLLGKGGMGEVYRADDLKLRQPVALKFLPETLSKDPRKLERFHHEVRVARQVSHPNVCRVYDIGEADGQHFISMEYVDGEDLASVLRRMGRPSKDKALQIARQLCAGLAAAHDKGVLHRDLKPHNVMVDARGRVRVTDFGLAGFLEEFSGAEVRAGTPAYMAPEQLAGRGVSVKSDLYSLGLVLFELFTGRRAFDGTTAAEVERSRSRLALTSLSSIVEDIDPAVERVILRCLEREPSARPSSALAVAAALPGGDPLAAALEAGETPDPAMVAAAGDVGGLRPAVALPCLAAFLVGIAAVALFNDSTKLFRQVPLEKPPQALADRASEIVRKLGHTDPVVDSAYAFKVDDDYLRYIEENDKSRTRWDRLASANPPGIYFWYRQSPQPLMPPPSLSNVTLKYPLPIISGMASVILDPLGRLIELNIVPPQKDESGASGESPSPTDWSVLFAEAQVDMADFTPVDPIWNPPVYCDERAAWKGSFPDQPDVPIRVEAGAYAGKPTFFQVVGPWTRPTRMEKAPVSRGSRAGEILFVSIVVCVLGGSVLVARRNLRLRRGDRAGAFRVSLFVLVGLMLNWLFGARHVIKLGWEEFFRFWFSTGSDLFLAAWLWLLYIALEPYVRRWWPQTLISWSRLLAGRFRDPLVGRDLLVGSLFGIALILHIQLGILVPGWLGWPAPRPGSILLDTLLGGRHLPATIVLPWFVFGALYYLFVLFVLRVLLRRQWLAVLVFLLLFTAGLSLQLPSDFHGAALYSHVFWSGLRVVIWLVVLLRFGLFALVAAFFVTNLYFRFPITFDISAFYVGGSVVALLAAVAVAAYGFHTALAGRPLFKDELLAE